MGKYLVILGGLLLLCGTGRADPVSPIWQVEGTLSILGNDSCAGPCVETINYSFEVEEQNGFAPILVVPGSIVSLVSDGPLGAFTFGGSNIDTSPFVAFDDAGLDEIDLYFANPLVNPGPPELLYSQMYECRTQLCLDDFGNPPGNFVFKLTGTEIATIGLVPEPTTLGLLLLGLAVLGTIRRKAFRRISA